MNAANVLEALDGYSVQQQLSCLASVIFFSCQSARGSYPAAGYSADAAARRLMAWNEVAIVCASQVIGLMGNDAMKRPNDALIETLRHWAAIGEFDDELISALRTSLL